MTNDLTLDAAFLAAKRRADRMQHGRLTLVVVKFDCCCTDWDVHEDRMTPEDLRRLMEQRPRGWRR